MAEACSAGEIVAVFPEGTTSDGMALLPFHANLLQAAISAGAPGAAGGAALPGQPARAASLTPCYIGDDTLVGSLWRTVTGSPVTAVVRFGSRKTASGRDRRAWAADLRAAWIDARNARQAR